MQTSSVLRKLRQGETVFCGKSSYRDPNSVGLLGHLGLDVVWICNEHIGVNPETLENMIRAGQAAGVDVMVRHESGRYSNLIQLLEMGAKGLMIPHCLDAEQLKVLVRETRFYPIGMRGIDGISADSDYGTVPRNEYIKFANHETFVMAQIEDSEALPHLEQMASVPGIDLLFVGALDLSQSMGIPGQTRDPRIMKVIADTVTFCEKYGKWAATSAGLDTEYARQLADMGVRFIALGSDYGMVKKGFMDVMAKLRSD